jgi:hypothetical protein
MQSTASFQGFSAHPYRGLRANPAALSTVGPTGAAAILNSESGQFYSLNEVGGRVWELLREGTTFGAIVDKLCGEYDATPETIGADMERLLAQFAGAGLVLIDGGNDGER